jgi:NAD(P)-dependent dehydrogenase (short-subunit alcohol dehydrogenase family)
VADLDGRVGFVTGAASGIARAVACAAARAGAAGLVLVDRDAEGLDETASLIGDGTSVITETLDLVDESAVSAAVKRCEELGQLSFAMNVAGIADSQTPVVDTELSVWRRVIDVNLTAAFICMKHELAAMGSAEGGAIVNVASGLGAYVAGPNLCAYVSSKAGLAMLTKVAALEQGATGIRVNGIAPGVVATPLIADWLDDMGSEGRDQLRSRHMLNRFGDPDEIAAGAIWLVSDDASFVTGTVLPVDGGFATLVAGS